MIIMECSTLYVMLDIDKKLFVLFFRALNGLIGFLNIVGNAFLIYALKRTGQTKTISMHYIIFMSASDVILGIAGIILVTMTTFEPFDKYCWLISFTQFTLNTWSSFSPLMVVLIAFDRYLHMKYLERYTIIVTKKRAYSLVIFAFIAATSWSTVLIIRFPKHITSILKSVYFSLAIPTIAAIFLLYRSACKSLISNSNRLSRRITSQNRALGKAAKLITICIMCLTTPSAILYLVEDQLNIKDGSVWRMCTWFAYVIFLANGICSSFIFIAFNKPVKNLLKRVFDRHLNRIQSKLSVPDFA